MAIASPVREPLRAAARWRFSVDDYARLHAIGLIPEDVRTELIEGEIYAMAPIGPGHAAVQSSLQTFLTLRLGALGLVRGQNPLHLDDRTLVQPDVHVVRPDPDGYLSRHPMAADTLLVVEVADASLRHDRQRKLPLYARFGIPEVWLVAPADQTLEVHREPVDGRYAEMRVLRAGETVGPACAPDAAVDVGALLTARLRA